MKKIDWKMLSLTSAVCLLPVLFGVVFYEKMPERMPVHFNINNEVDSYASKNFALFGIPILMTILQIFCCLISDWNGNLGKKKPKFISIVKWIVPILSVVISVIMIQIPLGSNVDVRRSIVFILGILCVIMGNYMPKMSYEAMKGKMHPMPKDEKLYRKAIRLMGYTFVIFGLLLLISIAFEAIISWGMIVMLVVILFMECAWVLIKNR